LPSGLACVLLQWSPSGPHQGVCDTHTPPSCRWCLSFCSYAWPLCPVSERSLAPLGGGATTPQQWRGRCASRRRAAAPHPGAGSQPPGTEGGPPEMEVGVAESEPGAATARLATWDVQHGRQGRLHVACRALSLVSVNCAPLQGARLAGDDRPLSCHGHRVSATHASHHQGGVALVWKDTSHWQVAATRKMLAASQPWSKIAWLCTREDLMSRESTSARRKIKNEGLVRHWCTSICILNSELRLSYLIRSNITSRGRRQQ